MARFILIMVLIVIGLVALAWYFPAKRKPLLIIAGVLTAVFIALATVQIQLQQREVYSDTGIMVLENFSVTAISSNHRLNTRIKNTSEDVEVTAVVLQLQVLDCPATSGAPNSEDCVIIGDALERIPVLIPPQQARDIQQSFHIPRLDPQGEMDWQLSVEEIQAHKIKK